MRPTLFSTAAGCALAFLIFSGLIDPARAADPERRALDYLSAEVPRWARENRCHSCHNNGDAARAIYDASERDRPVAAGSVDETTRWLARPEAWEKNGGDGPFNDRTLARVQFTAALAAAVSSGALKDRAPLDRAAARLAADQGADGSWPVDDGGNPVGSPAAYGKPLATWMAREALRAAGPAGAYREAVARADAWLIARPVSSVDDAAVALLAASGRRDALADRLRARALERLRAGQSEHGGWGPYVDAPPEPFDTALALLALARLDRTAETRAMLRRGRSYLVATQTDDGSWPETTRPPGAESYAQRLSTTGWATLALLATGDLER